jgi:drug/metabolite transporter (DMT)-like permease
VDVEANKAQAALHPLGGYAWMIVASVGFAFMNVFARMAHAHASWAQSAAFRCIVSVFVALAAARVRGVKLVIHDRRIAWARSIFGTLSVLVTFFVLSQPQIPVADVATLNATQPVLLALLAPLVLKERGGWYVYLAAAIAFGGVIVLVGPKLEIAGGLALLTLFGALVSAFAHMSLRKLGPTETPEAVVVHFSIVSAVVTTLLGLTTWKTPGLVGVSLLIGTGLAGGFAQLAMTRAYARELAVRVGVFGYTSVVLTQLLSFAILGEELTTMQLVGSSLVIFAGLFLAYRTSLEHARQGEAA